jgi:hypothetical protein
MKMPTKVWKEVVKIQRAFLWGGLSRRNKVCWVKWDDVCKPKKEAGLGIRDLRLMNLSLLAKWRWKLLSRGNEVWKDVLIAKYGGEVVGRGNLGDLQVSNGASTWWRDICLLDKGSNWFADAVIKRIGDGNSTSFWSEVWIGNQTLQLRFPRIFSIANHKDGTVASMGVWEGSVWRWVFSWRRDFFDWEVPIFREFLETIQSFTPWARDDIWQWRANSDDGFTVKEGYFLLLQKFRVQRDLGPDSTFVFSRLWKSGAPSKVCTFSWQVLLDRIQTKENLWRRGIIQQEQLNCVFCGASTESTVHLFLHCACSMKVWYEVMKWLGFIIIVPPNLVSGFGTLVGYGRGKNEKVCLALIWNSFLWSIWKFRNDCVFNNKAVIIEEVVDHVKFQAWKWFIGRVAKTPCLLYEWNWSL